MGNKTSMAIELDHGDSPIAAGTSVTGNVVLIVRKKLPTFDIDLRLQGVEATIIPKRNQIKHEEQTVARARTILKVKTAVPGNEDRRVIARGMYKLPFEFVLPTSLPSSTQFPRTDSKTFIGRIQYLLRATTIINGSNTSSNNSSNINTGNPDLRIERVFRVVAAPLPPTVVPCISQPSSLELKQAKLLKKGFLSFVTCVENTRVGKGKQVKVSVACRNSSTVNVERVRIKLVELIEYKSQGETSTIKNELRSLKDIDLPGLNKHRSSDVRMSKRRFSECMVSTHRELLQDLLSGQNQFSVPIPTTARDTYSGCLMTVSHYIKISFITGSTLVDNPSFKLPIVVGTPSEQQQQERAPNEPIATAVLIGNNDDIRPFHNGHHNMESDASDQSTVEVGSAVAVPMADAMLLDSPTDASSSSISAASYSPPPEERPDSSHHRRPTQEGDPVVIGASNVFPVPSAPDESFFLDRGQAGRQARPAVSPQQMLGRNHPSHQPPPAYSPFAMYSNGFHDRVNDRTGTSASVSDSSTSDASSSYMLEQPNSRNRIDSYSYTDSISGVTQSTARPQLGHAQQGFDVATLDRNRMLQQILSDLRASIHDYEVISGKVRILQYQMFFSSLSPLEFGTIIQATSMPHQVEVANLLARQMVYESTFTCQHCASAVKHANNYTRTSMVDILTPMVVDFTENSQIIRQELSAWELAVTEDVFVGLS